MQGNDFQRSSKANDGVVCRALDYIFEACYKQKEDGWTYCISLEVVEIYNEQVRDLLLQARVM